MVRADRKKTYRKPGTAAMQKGQQARQQGNRVWKLEALGWQVTVTERLNDPETAAGRSTGRLCFYYPAAPKTPSAKKRARLERSLLPYTLAALGLPPGATTHRVRRAGCECGCSPGYSIAIPGERRRELYAEALPLEKTEQP